MMERSDSLCGERDGARTRSIFTAAFVDAFPAGFDFDDDPGRFFAALPEPDRDDNFFRTIIASPSTKIGVCAAHGTPDYHLAALITDAISTMLAAPIGLKIVTSYRVQGQQNSTLSCHHLIPSSRRKPLSHAHIFRQSIHADD
jgi:hypothetical protein